MSRDPGFRGLLDAGHTPREAWQIIHDDLAAEPGALDVIAGLPADTLEWSRAQWASHGLRPPWEDQP